MTREGLELSICVDAKASLEGGQCVLRLFGTADDAALRADLKLMNILTAPTLPEMLLHRGDSLMAAIC